MSTARYDLGLQKNNITFRPLRVNIQLVNNFHIVSALNSKIIICEHLIKKCVA